MESSRFVSSEVTLGKVPARPRKVGSISNSDRVRAYFASGSIEVLPFTLDTAEQFASIRAWTRVQSADAIHLASASLAQVDLLLTNDTKLQTLSVPGIRRVAGLDPRMIQMLFP